MQVWTDISTGRSYNLDTVKGVQSPSDRFGNKPCKFMPYASGYPRALSQSPTRFDQIYSVQPSKFDGYSQFPRPRVSSPAHSLPPIDKSCEVSNRPKHLNHLTRSAVYDKSITPPKLKYKHKSIDFSIITIAEELEHLKKSSNTMSKEIKTIDALDRQLKQDKDTFKPYIKKESLEERRKLKGYFMKNFLTGVDLYEKERSVIKKTNRMFFERLKHMEELDRKNLEKRKLQKLSQMRREFL